MRPRIVLGGSLAQKPGRGGHTWVFLQYLLGLRRLGWDVLFLDRLDTEMASNEGPGTSGGYGVPDDHPGVSYVRRVFDGFGLGDAYAVAVEGVGYVGRTRSQVLDFVGSSVAFINVMGFIRDPDILARASLVAFLDIDPGFPQIWHDLGLHDAFAGHDKFVTIGERIGEEGCSVPQCGRSWITTPQPVVLEAWPESSRRSDAFTSVASWRGNMAPLEYGGRTLGLRVHEFRRFLELPCRTKRRFKLALDIHPDETRDLALLTEHGWTLVDPVEAAGDPWRYQAFIQASGAELMIAKNLYVETRAGWFSDRSICYLASGRPVLAQDTGFSSDLPVGRGLLGFNGVDEAVAGVEAIMGDPELHARAARDVAEAYFGSDLVLTRLVESLTASEPSGVCSSAPSLRATATAAADAEIP